MPYRLIGILGFAVVVAVLTGKNLENTCSIWFFRNFSGIPVFAAIMSSFILGVFTSMLCMFVGRAKKRAKAASKAEKKDENRKNEPKEEKAAGSEQN